MCITCGLAAAFLAACGGLIGDSPDLIRKVPNEKIIIETDCPFMTPEPWRGQRNEPIYVKQVAARIAEIKNLTRERVAEITTNNAKILFNI